MVVIATSLIAGFLMASTISGVFKFNKSIVFSKQSFFIDIFFIVALVALLIKLQFGGAEMVNSSIEFWSLQNLVFGVIMYILAILYESIKYFILRIFMKIPKTKLTFKEFKKACKIEITEEESEIIYSCVFIDEFGKELEGRNVYCKNDILQSKRTEEELSSEFILMTYINYL